MVLPKGMRLKGYKCFDYIHKFAKRYQTSSMMLKVVQAKNVQMHIGFKLATPMSCRCAISISNKVSKKAVVRNRLRRLLHEHLRMRLFEKKELGGNWALLSLKPCCLEKNSNTLLKECDKLLREAGFIS